MLIACLSQLSFAGSSAIQQTKGDFEDKFRQLDEVLPTPNVYRNAAGAPGHKYWQQKVDYLIDVTLDEANRRLEASQTVTYTNNSPDTLTYLWVQLDQNKFKSDSMSTLTTTFGGIGNRGPATQSASDSSPAQLSLRALRRQQFVEDTPLGYELTKVADARGNALEYVVVGTLMRIDLRIW